MELLVKNKKKEIQKKRQKKFLIQKNKSKKKFKKKHQKFVFNSKNT